MRFGSRGSGVAGAAVVVALLGLLAFGVLGLGRGGDPAFDDVRYCWVAGRLAADGSSPYDHAAFEAAARRWGEFGSRIDRFAYPPHSLPLCTLLAQAPIGPLRWVWAAANLAILLASAWAMGLRYAHRVGRHGGLPTASGALWIAAIVIGNPFAAHLLWTGQSGLIALACLLLAWHADKRGHWLVAGLLLGLATVKPQLALLAVAWFLFSGSWRSAMAAAAAVALLTAAALAQAGPGLVPQWIGTASAYEAQFMTGLAHNTNLKSLLLGLGLALPRHFTAAMATLGVAAVALLAWRQRRRPLAQHDVQALLLAASLVLVHGRDYDMAVLAPLVPMLAWHTRGRRAARAAALAALVLMCLPQRWLAGAMPPLPSYRLALLAACWLWATALALSAAATPTRARSIDL